MEQAPLVPGYEVLAPLGQGASATVWRARRVGDGLDVALKVLTPARGNVGAGLREAGLLAGVRHPHVVRLHDVLPLPDPATGRPAAVALATQLADGGSLAQVLARRRMLSAGELVTALQPVAGALADLHGQGIVHGDLSTGNVLFLRDGMPLLADLGSARITGAPAGDPQGTGAASGLVAPEVVEGFAPTQESDVYQLGALAWLCLAGQPPGPPWSRGALEDLAPGLPDGLAELVSRCLAPEPGDRPDAEEVALALLAAAAPEPVEVAPDADPAHGLTERLRRQAQDDLGAVERDGARRRRGYWPVGRGRRERDGRGGSGAHRAGRMPVVGDGSGSGLGRSRTLTWVAVMVFVLAGLGAAGLVIGPDVVALVRDGARSGAAAAPQAPSTATPTPPDTSGGGDPTPPDTSNGGDPTPPDTSGGDDPTPPDTSGGDDLTPPDTSDGEPGQSAGREPVRGADGEVVSVLQALVDGRAEAWESGDVELLDRVLAVGSPAMESESTALERARRQGLTYADVRFTVDEAAVVQDAPGRLTIDAVVTRDALRGIDAEGNTVVEERATTEQVRLVLARATGQEGWLLWSWAPR